LKGEGSWADGEGREKGWGRKGKEGRRVGEGREKGWGAGKRENDNMENLL